MEIFDFQETDWTMYFMEQYFQVLITSPLVVHDTLLSVQYHHRNTPEEFEQIRHDNSTKSLYLVRLHSDFPSSYRIIQPTFGATFYLRGHLTLFLHQSLFNIITPFLEESLNDVLDIFEDTNPWTLVLAHATVGALLSPLELIRTRLIVQSPDPARKSYFGPFDALFSLTKEKPIQESGWLKTVYQPYVVLPTVGYHAISALIRFGSKVVIENELGLDSSFDPIMYKLAQFVCLGLEAAILTPLEVARKRLYVQRLDAKSVQYSVKESSKALDCCVETFEGVYSGAFDVVSEIIGEEGISVEKKKVSTEDWDSVYGGVTKKEESWIKGFGNGISSLYRGFWSRYTLLTIQFIAQEITNEEKW